MKRISTFGNDIIFEIQKCSKKKNKMTKYKRKIAKEKKKK